MKHQTPELMKFKKLQRRLGLPRYAVVGLLESLWIATQKNCPAGDIGQFDNEEIAIELDWEGDADELVGAMVETGWLDSHPEHRLVVHDWHEHAPNHVRGNLARHKREFATKGASGDSAARSEQPTNSSVPRAACSGHPASRGRIKPNQTKPNPSSPLPPPCFEEATVPGADPDPEEEGEGACAARTESRASLAPDEPPPNAPAWSAAERVGLRRLLRSLGVNAADVALREAEARGITPAEIQALIEHWRAHGGGADPPDPSAAWDAGALYERIKSAEPGEPADKLWPRPSEAYRRTRAARSQADHAQRQRRETAAADARREAMRQRVARLEERWGEHLAMLPRDDLRALAERALGGNVVMLRMFRERGLNGPARQELLEHLDRESREVGA